ncbi:MAG: twin-arginine translocase TatA/TatE family subunit [Microthrixaceae bacterium]
MFSGNEWIIVVVVALVLFGGSQIPKLARSLGQAQKEFKAGISEGESEEAAEKADEKKADAKKADAKKDSTSDA